MNSPQTNSTAFYVAVLIGLSVSSFGVDVQGQNERATATKIPTKAAPPSLKEYREFVMRHDGDVTRGRELFNNEQRLACVKCHSMDGTSSKAGPDLFAAGDKFPRGELIRSILEPSESIAVGYGTTIVETKSNGEHQGIIKQVT